MCPLRAFATSSTEKPTPFSVWIASLAFAQLLREYQHRFTPENQEKYMEMLQQFVENVPIYVLTCNMDAEAAVVAYEGMKHGGN